VTASYSRAVGETVLGGPYHIAATLAPSGVLSNYTITNAGANFTITKALLTVTANSTSRTYGDPNPTFTANYMGFKNGETLATSGVTGSPSLTTTATTTSPVPGPYTITAALGTLAAGNYNFTFFNGALTINKATLTVTADNKTKILNAANPTLTPSYSGFKNGETLATSGVTGSPSLTTTATSISPVGPYPIIAALGTLAANNYTFGFVNGTLSILYASGGMCGGDVGHQVLQPINADNSSVFKLGSTVPTKFRVCDANGVSIQASGPNPVVASYQLIAAGTSTGLTIDESVYSTTPDTAFRWAGDQWIFNQATKNNGSLNQTNTIYVFRINLNDGSYIPFQYGLK